MILKHIRIFAGSPIQHFFFTALIPCEDRESVFSEIIVLGNSLYDPISFLICDSTLSHKMFQEITDACQIHQLEFFFLVIRHIPHLLDLL